MSGDAILMARRLVAEATERPLADIPEGASITTLPAWDSLAHVRLIIAIEAALAAPLQTDEMLSIESVEAVSNLIQQKARN